MARIAFPVHQGWPWVRNRAPGRGYISPKFPAGKVHNELKRRTMECQSPIGGGILCPLLQTRCDTGASTIGSFNGRDKAGRLLVRRVIPRLCGRENDGRGKNLTMGDYDG